MPSARELLEQADALMRRNRSPLMDDIPVLTDSVREIPAGRPVQPKRTEPDFDTPDTIPMLTDNVADAPEEPAPAAPSATTQAVVGEGEPSDWLQLGGAEPSVIGESPDSIAIVPPLTDGISEEIEVEAPLELEEAFDAELAQRDAAGASPPPSSFLESDARARIAATEVQIPQSNAPAWEEDTIVDMATHDHEPASFGAEQPIEIAPAGEEIAPSTVEAITPPAVEEIVPTVQDVAPPAVEEVTPRTVEQFAAPPAEQVALPESAALQPVPTAAELQAEDDARWASMAEEIRMQVLQRIDLFTDTGLRQQLGARLQPIVDRASADLVATINQHVGDLLRSYVAEAIEREIENWRRGN